MSYYGCARYYVTVNADKIDEFRESLKLLDSKSDVVEARNGRHSVTITGKISIDDIRNIEYVESVELVPMDAIWFSPYIPQTFSNYSDTKEKQLTDINKQISIYRIARNLLGGMWKR